jgi:V8-like Glu-specific endopeptidase
MLNCKNLTLSVWICLCLSAVIETALAAPAAWTLDAAYDCNPSVVRAIKDDTSFSWYSTRGLVSWRETRVATQNGDTICAEETSPNPRTYSESEYKGLRAEIADAQKRHEKTVDAEDQSSPSAPQLKSTTTKELTLLVDAFGNPVEKPRTELKFNVESSAAPAPILNPQPNAGQSSKRSSTPKILFDAPTTLWQYDDRIPADYSGFPGRTIAYLQATFSNSPAGTGVRCSGTLIAPNVVMTAAHCIFSADANGINALPATFEVFPGLYTNQGTPTYPFGKKSAVSYYYIDYFKTHYDSANGKSDANILGTDIAAVVLNTPFALTTFLPVAYSDNMSGATSQGYPAYVNNNYTYDQYFNTTKSTTLATIFYSVYPLFVTGGNSGGPLYIQRSDQSLWLVGNVSAGNSTSLPINLQATHYEDTIAGDIIKRATADATTLLASAITPQTGWWWNPNDVAGRGYSVEVSNGRIFLAAYMFRDDSTPVWYIADEVYNAPSFSGTLYDVQGTQTLNSTSKGTTATGPTSIQISGTFTSATQGTLTLTGGPLGTTTKTIPITRFPIDSVSVKAPSSSAAPQTGWWSNGNEPGVGYFIEQQGAQIFFANYLYGADQRDVWYIALNGVVPNGTSGEIMTGSLLQVTGGQTLTSGPLTAVANTIGQVTVQFTTPTSGMVTLPNGRLVPITRFTAF